MIHRQAEYLAWKLLKMLLGEPADIMYQHSADLVLLIKGCRNIVVIFDAFNVMSTDIIVCTVDKMQLITNPQLKGPGL